ncbi:MAG: GNAT family N-acetyltransferase [Lachnospiraceae bacterium]|nr:GNAT family N-acetyltransferase [Lachnospiraceae bacterium]
MKAIEVKDEWARAGVYYVRTEAMVLGFNLNLEGEFSGDGRDSEYILVTDDNGKPLSTNRIHVLPDKGYAKIERVATVSYARKIGAGKFGIEAAEKVIYEKGYRKIVITSREEAAGFYEKLGYKIRKDMNPDTLEPYKEGETLRVRDPRFICVYMEKEL